MSPASRLHDITALGIGVFIGASGAMDNGGMVLVGLCVAAVFVVARTIEEHYVRKIERVWREK